jgi:hypothetical protein
MEPATIKHESRHLHVFVFGGCAWSYVVSNRPLTGLMPLSLRDSGELPMLRQQITQLHLIRDFLVDHHQSASGGDRSTTGR